MASPLRHTVFQLRMEKRDGTSAVASEVFFVDLAGRENEKTTRVSGVLLHWMGASRGEVPNLIAATSRYYVLGVVGKRCGP